MDNSVLPTVSNIIAMICELFSFFRFAWKNTPENIDQEGG